MAIKMLSPNGQTKILLRKLYYSKKTLTQILFLGLFMKAMRLTPLMRS